MRRTLTDRQWEDYFATIRTARPLLDRGWLAAALDLDREIDLRPRGRPGFLHQHLGVSVGRRFLSLGVRPAGARSSTFRSLEESLKEVAPGIGYSRMRDHLKYPDDGSRYRLLRTRAGADRDLLACFRSLTRGETPARPKSGTPLPRSQVTVRSADRVIRRILEEFPLGGSGAWQPAGLVYRFDARFRLESWTWHAMADLTYGCLERTHVGLWIQTLDDIDVAGWNCLRKSAAFLGLLREIAALGARIDTGPRLQRRHGLVYLGARFPGRTFRALRRNASAVTSWLERLAINARGRRSSTGGSRR